MGGISHSNDLGKLNDILPINTSSRQAQAVTKLSLARKTVIYQKRNVGLLRNLGMQPRR